MGRKRKALAKVWEGAGFVARFQHPLFGQAMRWPLGSDSGKADDTLRLLNSIFLHPERWRDPPATISEEMRRRWLGEDRGLKWDDDEAHLSAAEADVAARTFQRLYEEEKQARQRAEKLLMLNYRQRVRQGPSPTLAEALTTWLENFKGRDPDYMYNTERDLIRFRDKFGAEREVDSFIGRELELKNYFLGLGVGPSRRNDIRKAVLRFLEDSGAALDRKQIPGASTAAVRAKRGPIRWLERPQAEALLKKLKPYWADVFRVQVGLGLRPDELPTLHRENFSNDFSQLTLSPREHLTLKTGSRAVNVPKALGKRIEARLKAENSGILFPQMSTRIDGNRKVNVTRSTGALWKTMDWFDRKYVRELNAAKDAVNADEALQKAAKIHVRLDARIGRRTCGSLLLRAGRSISQVASVLGDTERTVREHYAKILSGEVDPSAAAI